MKKVVWFFVSLMLLVILGASAYADSYKQSTNSYSSYFSANSPIETASDSTDNLSGYALTGTAGSYNSVSSSWTQPDLNCSALKENSYSADWVGLDGFGDQTIEQIGTEANCVNGQATYFAWYEMYPADPYQIPIELTIYPGDFMSATVNFTADSTGGHYSLDLSDATTGRSYSTTITPSETFSRSSAEVIAEAPYQNGTLPLADYGKVNFSNVLVNGTAMGSQPNLESITMHNPANIWSKPSTFDTNDQNFSISWYK